MKGDAKTLDGMARGGDPIVIPHIRARLVLVGEQSVVDDFVTDSLQLPLQGLDVPSVDNGKKALPTNRLANQFTLV